MVEALKYLDPIWYFNLPPLRKKNIYFPDYRKLSAEEKKLIDFDPDYKAMSLQDAAFQALKKGIIVKDPSACLDASDDAAIPLSDQYRFVRKYYHSTWSVYFLLIRTMMLKNPIRELKAFLQNLSVKRIFLYASISDRSPGKIVLPANPTISVILPSLNRYEHLKNILEDLSKQTLPPSEIIVVDQSDPVDTSLYDSFGHLQLRIIYQKEKGQWLARNEAIRISTGAYILLADDDSRVKTDWVAQHLKGLLFFEADISAGVSIPEDTVPGKDKTFFHWAEEFDSGNAMVRRDVFKKIGLFDRAFDRLRMGDTEFGLRAYLAGLTSISNPLAGRIHVLANKGGMRYWGSKDAFRPINFFSSRPNNGVLYLYQQFFKKRFACSFLLIRIFLSFRPLRMNNSFGSLTAFLLFTVCSPWWLSVLLINWKRTKRIRPHIEDL